MNTTEIKTGQFINVQGRIYVFVTYITANSGNLGGGQSILELVAFL